MGLDDAMRVHAPDGAVAGVVVLNLTLYIRHGDRPEVRAGLVAAYEAYVRAAGGMPFQWGVHPSSGQVETITPGTSTLADVRQWPASLIELYDLQMIFGGGAPQDGDVDPYRFSAVSREERPGELSYVHATLPLLWAEAYAPSDFTALVFSFCEALGPSHGYAGLAIVPHPDGPANVAPLFDLARRFEGLDLDSPAMYVSYLATANLIKGVSWLTVLGKEWLDRLGGEGQLLANQSSELQAFRFRAGEGGLIFQAGAAPRLGDTLAQEPMGPYRSLGAIVAPVVMRNPILLRAEGGFTHDEGARWLARFG
jgi:hypothetical protein